jgi:transcriptional regulator of acetoin/glycerol metabolism
VRHGSLGRPLKLSELVTFSSSTRRIWEDFAEGKDAGLSTINPVIRDSWLRSRQHGLNARMKSVPIVIPQARIQTILHETRLDRAAVGTNRLLIEAIAGRSSLVLLLNSNGVLLQLLGDPGALERAARIGIVPGCQMSENSIGTDAISCSLALGRPISIAFAEHYIEVGHEWAGSAAPLRQPFTNEIVGCLSIYGHGGLAHPNALDFLTAASQLVESELQNLETRARFILLRKYEQRRIEFPNDELICVSHDGIACAGSTGALGLLGLPQMAPGDLNGFVRVLDRPDTGFDRNNLQSRQMQLRSRRGDALKADLLPVVDDGELVGFV